MLLSVGGRLERGIDESMTHCFIKSSYDDKRRIAVIYDGYAQICGYDKVIDIGIRMKQRREYAGSVYSEVNHSLIVGGGTMIGNHLPQTERVKNTVEYMDLSKQMEWNYLGNDTNEYHDCRPCLWFDRYNKNVLYIAGSNIINGKYNQMGKIEYCDIREGKWNLYAERHFRNDPFAIFSDRHQGVEVPTLFLQ